MPQPERRYLAATPESPRTDRQKLLAEVLAATLARGQEDPDALLATLRDWKRSLPDGALSEARMAELVRLVLRQRFGDRAASMPTDMAGEIARVLWEDPVSHQRIEGLWDSLENA